MARRSARLAAKHEQSLEPVCITCPACGRAMWADYSNHRTVVTLSGLLGLHLLIRRCPHADCARFHRPYRPEAEGAFALPQHEVGLDVIALIRKGLEQTHDLWPAVRTTFAWVHRAAHILKNAEGRSAREVMYRLRALLGAMARHREKAGPLAPAVTHFLKVSRSYWPGLFHCYTVPDLPRTNNDLE